jgi:HEAT repeat protein
MKKITVILASLILLAAFSTLAAGADRCEGISKEKYAAAVENLLIGLGSDNTGLKSGCAFMLGELKATEAVVPLMAVLKSDACEECRTVAALALCRIGDERGSYAVKRAVRFDESSHVQQKCAWFYEQYVTPGSFGFVTEPQAVAFR